MLPLAPSGTTDMYQQYLDLLKAAGRCVQVGDACWAVDAYTINSDGVAELQVTLPLPRSEQKMLDFNIFSALVSPTVMLMCSGEDGS